MVVQTQPQGTEGTRARGLATAETRLSACVALAEPHTDPLAPSAPEEGSRAEKQGGKKGKALEESDIKQD